MTDREAFQEIDFRRMFGEMAKWVAQVDDAARMPEYVNQAFHRATAGRPGPVVLALPEDMLRDAVSGATVPAAARPVRPHPSLEDMTELRRRLAEAERPLVLVGGGAWDADACADLQRFAEANHLPVAAAFRCQHLFDNGHPLYIGDVGIGINPKLAARVQASDLLIALGPRLGEMTTGGYTLLDIPEPDQPLIHIHPGAEELGRVYRPALGINAAPGPFTAAAAALEPVHAPWSDDVDAARAEYEAWNEPTDVPGDVNLGQAIKWLRDNLPADAIMCNGAGNFSAWVHRFHRYRGFGTQLAPTSGSMGYGMPAAVAAKKRFPERTVVCVAGDGDFMMTGQELATAVHHGLGIIVLIVNNGFYGTIRMHQERDYPGRVIATDLTNPDFAALAEAYGAHGAVVERTEDFPAAFETARAYAGANARPAVIELRVEADAITPTTTLSKLLGSAI